MKRDIKQLAENSFDVLIIGGGIYGASIAQKISCLGIKTALIEQKDFSHATSANSLKIIHGGLRYLQDLNIKRMRESIKARRELIKFAPHLVRPLRCIMPTYGYGLRGKEVMQAALFINDLISYDRNHSIIPENFIPAGKIISKKSCLNKISEIPEKKLRGAGLWYDGFAINTERIPLLFIQEAANNGTCIANYLKAIDIKIQNRQIRSVQVEDAITGKQFNIKTKIVINAAGPWIDKIHSFLSKEDKKPQAWARGINIVVKKKIFPDIAVGLEGSRSYIDTDAVFKKGKRLYFFIPWRGYTLIGTEYKPYQGSPDNIKTERSDLVEFVEEINMIYPPAKLSLNHVTSYHAGLLPMSKFDKHGKNDVQLEKNSKLIDHEKTNDIKGLITIKGVKYTTATQTALEVKRLISRYVSSANLTKPSKKIDSVDSINNQSAKKDTTVISKNSDAKIIQHLKINYGQQYRKVLQFAIKKNCPNNWISREPPITLMEILYSIQEEMALTLSDIIFRRTDLGTAECPSLKVLNEIANIMATKLKWDEKQKTEEIENVLADYYPLIPYEFKTQLN